MATRVPGTKPAPHSRHPTTSPAGSRSVPPDQRSVRKGSRLAHPSVGVQVGTRRFTAPARVASSAERKPLWAQMAHIFPLYDEYAQKTDRVIPIVLLTPQDCPSVCSNASSIRLRNARPFDVAPGHWVVRAWVRRWWLAVRQAAAQGIADVVDERPRGVCGVRCTRSTGHIATGRAAVQVERASVAGRWRAVERCWWELAWAATMRTARGPALPRWRMTGRAASRRGRCLLFGTVPKRPGPPRDSRRRVRVHRPGCLSNIEATIRVRMCRDPLRDHCRWCMAAVKEQACGGATRGRATS
jgi:hypothetical protein